MENTELLAIWKAYDKKLEDNLTLNKQTAAELTGIKVRSLLSSMKPVKIFAVLVGIAWGFILDTILINTYPAASMIFLVSAGLQSILTKIAIGIYIYQLVLIHNTNITLPVFDTQARLASLRSSTLLITRLLILQIPLWTTFYWNGTMLNSGHILLLILQAAITLGAIALSAWLFINIRYSNRDKKWFRMIFNGSEWEPMIKSMQLLEEIKDIKAER